METLPETTGHVHEVLRLQQLGYRVVALRPRTKRPAFAGWQTKVYDEADLRGLFHGTHFNVGILTGDPLIVLDTDTEEAEAWVRTQGIDSPTVVRSGRGGLHRYFLRPRDTEVHSKSGLHGIRGLDVKGWHSFIVAAGSVHPDTHLRYTYLPGKHLRDLSTLPLFDPAWLGTPIPGEPQGEPKTPPRSGPLPLGRKRVRNVPRYVLAIPSVQGRNGSAGCYRVCCVLRDAGYPPEAAWDVLLWWNARTPRPPWSRAELLHKLESVYQVPLRGILS